MLAVKQTEYYEDFELFYLAVLESRLLISKHPMDNGFESSLGLGIEGELSLQIWV